MNFAALARILVTHTPVTGVTQDSRGNDVPAYGSGVSKKAFSFSPHRAEDTEGHTSRDIAEVDLALPTTTVNLMDQFTLDGQVYEVVGVRDNNGGFHGWKPGVVAELKRVTG